MGYTLGPEISAPLSCGSAEVFVSAAAQASADWKQLTATWAEDRSVSIAAIGGDSSLLGALAPGFHSNFNTAFTQWTQSIMLNPQVMGFALTPLSDVFSGVLGAAVEQALAAFLNAGLYVQADFSTGGGLNGNIQLEGDTIPNPNPPSMSSQSSAQLVVFDGTSLDVLVNVAQSGASGESLADVWNQFEEAVNDVTGQSYIVALTVSGFMLGGGYPSSAFALWLQDCGVTLSAWNGIINQYCNDDFQVSYAAVGQQGLGRGEALEKFNSNLSSYSTSGGNSSVLQGDFFANVTAPLNRPGASASYTILAQYTSFAAKAKTLASGRRCKDSWKPRKSHADAWPTPSE